MTNPWSPGSVAAGDLISVLPVLVPTTAAAHYVKVSDLVMAGNANGITVSSRGSQDAGIIVNVDPAAIFKGDFTLGDITSGRLAPYFYWFSDSAANQGHMVWLDGAGNSTFLGPNVDSTNTPDFEIATGANAPSIRIAQTTGAVHLGNTLASTLIGPGTALATSATTGLLMIPTCAGTASGSVGTAGQCAMLVDTSGSKIGVNWGSGWKWTTVA